MVEKYCCSMRAKFIVAIIDSDQSQPDPPELLDFVRWDLAGPGGQTVLRPKFCCWCGKELKPDDPVRIAGKA